MGPDATPGVLRVVLNLNSGQRVRLRRMLETWNEGRKRRSTFCRRETWLWDFSYHNSGGGVRHERLSARSPPPDQVCRPPTALPYEGTRAVRAPPALTLVPCMWQLSRQPRIMGMSVDSGRWHRSGRERVHATGNFALEDRRGGNTDGIVCWVLERHFRPAGPPTPPRERRPTTAWTC